MHLIDANAAANGLDLAPHRIPGVGPSERGGFKIGLPSLGEIIWHFESKLRAPDRAHGAEMVVHGGTAQAARGGQLFIGIADREPPLIILNDLGHRVSRRDPCAKAGAIHCEDIALRLALYHPLRKGQPNAAALAEAGHNSAGGPIVAHPGHRPHEGIAVGRKGERAVDHRFNTGRFKCRETLIRKGDAVFDLVKVIGQKLMAEVPGRAIDGPRTAGLFIKSDAKAAAFLAQVALACGIHHMGMLAACVNHSRNLSHIFGHDILMLHWEEWEINARHGPHFARPKAGSIDNMLCVNATFICDEVPSAIGPLCGGEHFAMGLNMRPAHPGGLGIGMGCAGRIEMPVKRVIKPTDDPVGIGHRSDFGNLIRADDFGLQAHIAVFGALSDQHIKAILIIRQGHAAHMMQSARHAGHRLKLSVKLDGVAL